MRLPHKADASGDHLYYSDRQNRLVEMTWNTTNQDYENPVACNDINADNPQDPYHLVFDGSLGILVTDQNDRRVKQQNSCDAAAQQASIDELPDIHAGVRAPIAVALMNLGLEIYVEVAPGYDLYRSDSCSFVSGVDSICPHALSPRGFVQGVVGARYHL